MDQKMEMYHKAMEFAKHHRPDGPFSNIYVAQTIDHDGNVTSETYGMNMLTEYGLTQFFGENPPTFSNYKWPLYLYIGDGTDYSQSMINHNTGSSHQLFHYFTQEHDVDAQRDYTIDYKYPMYYYQIPGDVTGDGIVTCVCKFRKFVFGESINNVSTEFNITEYGIGESPTKIWTHSWVYSKKGDDETYGRYTTIVKRPGEKLEITVFFCMSYKTSMIKNAWDNGIYTVITTLERFVNNRMSPTKAGTYKRNNVIADRTITNTFTPISQHSQTRTTTISAFTMTKSNDAAQGYLDGFYSWTNGFVTIEPDCLTSSKAEAFDTIYSPDVGADRTGSSIANAIGTTKSIPFSQADIQNVYTYNRFHTANESGYSNPVTFTNDPNHWYTETPMQIALYAPIYWTDINDNTITLYLYQNTNTSDPIIQFSNTTISSIYATDEYWDRSKWIYISDPFNIPAEARSKRYYITSSNETSLNPIRQSGLFSLIADSSVAENKTYSFAWNRDTEYQGLLNSCEDYDRHYFTKGGFLYLTDVNTRFSIYGDTSGLARLSYCYHDYIVTSQESYQFILTNCENHNSPYNLTFSIGSTGNKYGNRYITESKTGIICFFIGEINEACILNLTKKSLLNENDFERKILNAKIACAMYITTNSTAKRIAYITTDTTPTLKVFDIDEDTDVAEFNLPSGVTDANLIWACDNRIWITDGTSWCYLYELNGNPDGVACTNNMTLVTNKNQLCNVRWTFVNDVIMVYRQDMASTTSSVFYMLTDSPSVIRNLGDFTIDKLDSDVLNTGRYQLRYINNGKTLALCITRSLYYSYWYSYFGGQLDLIDFGQYLNPETDSAPTIYRKAYYCRFDSSGGNGALNWILYGENLIYGNTQTPLLFYMPCRIVGTTRTHSAVMKTKHVTGKQFTITYTNSPPAEWSSDRPGYPPGVLN